MLFLSCQDPKLSSAGKGLHPLVLTFTREDSFSGTSMAAAFSSSDHAPPPAVCSSSSWTSGSGEAVFPPVGLSTVLSYLLQEQVVSCY